MSVIRDDAFTIPDSVWRSIAEEAADAVFVTDGDLRILWVNRRACEVLARSNEEMVGKLVQELLWDPPAELSRLPIQQDALRAGRSTVTQRVFRTGRGERRVLEVTAQKIERGLLVGIARDVTERLEAMSRLERSEASFRALIEKSPDGTVVHADGIIQYVSTVGARMLGYGSPAELLGKQVIDLVHPDDRPLTRARIAALTAGVEPQVPFTEQRLLRRDGTSLVASIGGVRVDFEGRQAIASIARDVTEQRALEAQLAQSERMAAIGMLAAGVAHEINNPLGYLMLRLGAIRTIGRRMRDALGALRIRLEERLGPDEVASLLGEGVAPEAFAEVADHVSTALEGAERMHAIVNDLRVSSRTDDAREEIQVRSPLERALGLAGHELGKRARVETSFEDTPAVVAAEGRLTQVFLNLLINAAQAIDQGDPAANVVRIATWSEGERVCVSIGDTGAGIAAEHLPRLFEPFFTTKPVGVGTGLGLSICHGIVTSLGGTIHVESTVGRGTTFTVRLPAAPI